MEVIVFTNGCFDILHPGHIDLLEKAKKLGNKLIVGINSDESVRAIKGSPRPFISEKDRAAVLMGLSCVDEVVTFNEPTPQQIIEKIKPDVLVKGGDWTTDQIIGADFVKKRGGKVLSIPLKEGFSSSSIVEKILASQNHEKVDKKTILEDLGLVEKGIEAHLEVFQNLLQNEISAIEKCGKILVEAAERGNKIIICVDGKESGNLQCYATQLVEIFEKVKPGFAVNVLTPNSSGLEKSEKNNNLEEIFLKKLEELVIQNDVVIGISISGNSPNVISGVMLARQKGCRTIGLTGAKGKKLASLCDASVLVPSERTSRIQEAHITIENLWCEILEAKF